MIEADLKAALGGNAGIAAIVSSRIFLKNPINKQTAAYLTYNRQGKSRTMVSEQNRFQLIAFSEDTVELENLCTLIINFLENKKVLNNNFYYSCSLLGQTDSREKLDDGFFWSMLNFEFKHTT